MIVDYTFFGVPASTIPWRSVALEMIGPVIIGGFIWGFYRIEGPKVAKRTAYAMIFPYLVTKIITHQWFF